MLGKYLKSQQTARIALLALLAVMICVLAALSMQLRGQLREVKIAPMDNLHWNVTQLELDLVRLQAELDIALLRPDHDLEELRKRYDLFYSRAQTVGTGSMFDRLDMSESVAPLMSRLAAFLEVTTPIIDGSETGLRTALPDIGNYTRELRRDLRSMAIEVIDEFATLADAQRAELAALLRRVAAATLGLVALLLVLLVWTLRLNRQAERQSAAAQRVQTRLAATVGTSLDAVIVAGMDGRIVDYNAAAERIFGYTPSEALGSDLGDMIVPPRHIAGHRAGMIRIAKGGAKHVVDSGRVQLTAMRKGGEEFPVEMSIASTTSPDGTLFIAYLRDISHRLAGERALLAARDEALAAERAKSTFLAVMSHEMRTPLNGVMAALEIIARKAVDKQQARFVGIAQASAEQLLHHVNDVLDISKIEAGKLALSIDDFDLTAMVETTCDALRPTADRRGNRIEMHRLGPLPAVRGDAFRIRQVLQNLLSNAIKFTDDGKIIVEIEPQDRTDTEVTVELRVTDTGIGIAEADLERVFEDFVMLDPSYGREAGGTGLGLAISRRLTEAMGGTMGVESEADEGSCFWMRLTLPIAESAAVQLLERPASRETTEHHEVAPPRPGLDVLVVEDNATNQIVLQELLEQLDHRVTLANDGAEGVRRARAHGYDLILMDISMPVLDGVGATRLIREAGKSRRCRIVAVTAHTMPEELARFQAAGMDDCLIKPISTRELNRVLAGVQKPEPAPAPVRPSALTDTPDEIRPPVLDGARLEDLRDGLGPQGLDRALARFLAETGEKLSVIHDSAGSAPFSEMLALCHEVAGAAGTMGAARLHSHLVAAEASCRAGDNAAVRAHVAELPRLWQETRTAFRQAMDLAREQASE